jgi:hypothetical protein
LSEPKKFEKQKQKKKIKNPQKQTPRYCMRLGEKKQSPKKKITKLYTWSPHSTLCFFFLLQYREKKYQIP